ncbi:MAG: zinc ribbon domain-containing protein [Acidobacteriaceae bacterium]|nr:zinc ribbon domain-containing protein [Acidobacteriaceae bacterium]
MFCDRCGTKLQDAQNFCPNCGKPVRDVPLMPVQSRIAGHVRLLAILWIAISAFRLLSGVVLLSLFQPRLGVLPPEVPFFVHGILHGVGLAYLATAILGFITAWGLLEKQPWARMLAIIFGCFILLDVPFGTALGIYTLWVLLPAQSEEEYRRFAKTA